MRKEILAGLSTFFTISYLILLYPKILSEGGIDFSAALTATILSIVISTTFLALYAKFPVVLAPGLSVGPFLVYSVILKDHVSWEAALGIVFWGGFAIFLLSVFKLRQRILFYLPPSIKTAAIAGIGLFLISVGLKNLNIFSGQILTLSNIIALIGLVVFFALYYFRVPGSFLIAIMVCWIGAIPLGLVHWDGFVGLPANISPTLFKLDFWAPLHPKLLGTVLSVILITLFDTSASLTALAEMAHKFDEHGQIKNIDRIVIPDGIGSMLSGLIGTGTLAFTIESASGIKTGGKTGITALVAALCCLIGLFFYPLISSIPFFATVPVLVAIGIFMAMEVRSIEWKKFSEAIPALLMLITIPLTFSIYQGFAYGFVSYTLLKAFRGEWRQVHPVCWGLAAIFSAHLSWALLTNHNI